MRGRGHQFLRDRGVEVVTGVLADAARRLHRGHILRTTEGRPAVTLKLAQTADGYAARLSGARLLITGERSNCRTHLIRAHADAIMVGVGTVLADDPQLTVRLPGMEDWSPVRVILDSRLRTPTSATLAATAREAPTWIICTEDAPAEAERRLTAEGAEVMRVGARDGRLDVPAAMRLLAAPRHHPRVQRGRPELRRGARRARSRRRVRARDELEPVERAGGAGDRPGLGCARRALPARRRRAARPRPPRAVRAGLSADAILRTPHPEVPAKRASKDAPCFRSASPPVRASRLGLGLAPQHEEIGDGQRLAGMGA